MIRVISAAAFIVFTTLSFSVQAEDAQEQSVASEEQIPGLRVLWQQYRDKVITQEEYIRRASIMMRGSQAPDDTEVIKEEKSV